MRNHKTSNTVEHINTNSGQPIGNERCKHEHFRILSKRAARWLAIVLATQLSVACALPVPIQVAMWAGDGISYMMSRKSLTDHGISTLVGQDCAMHRAITEDEICHDPQGQGTAIAQIPGFIEDWRAPEIPQGQENIEISIAPAANPSPAKAGKGGRYFVLGSFSSRHNAEELMGLSADLSPKLEMRGKGYLVVVGPVARGEMVGTYEEIRAAGFYEIWTYARNSGDGGNQFALISQPRDDVS